MRARDIFEKIFLGSKEENDIEETIKETLQEVKGTFKEDGIKQAANIAVDVIREQENNTQELIAIKILEAMEESKDLPDVVRVAVIAEMLKNEQIANEIPVKGIQKSNNFNTEQIQDLTQVAESAGVAKKIANEIPDEKVREEQLKEIEERERKEKQKEIMKRLRHMYASCDKHIDIDTQEHISYFIDELEEIKEQADSPEIDSMIVRVLARRCAIEWAMINSARMQEITRIITPERMMEVDLPELIAQEAKSIKDMGIHIVGIGNKNYPYQKEEFQKRVLSEIAKNVVKIYQTTGLIEVPQCEAMKTLGPEQKKHFYEQVEIWGKGEIRQDKLRRQLGGKTKAYDIEDLNKCIKTLPLKEREEYIEFFIKQIKGRRIEGQSEKGKVSQNKSGNIKSNASSSDAR